MNFIMNFIKIDEKTHWIGRIPAYTETCQIFDSLYTTIITIYMFSTLNIICISTLKLLEPNDTSRLTLSLVNCSRMK